MSKFWCLERDKFSGSRLIHAFFLKPLIFSYILFVGAIMFSTCVLLFLRFLKVTKKKKNILLVCWRLFFIHCISDSITSSLKDQPWICLMLLALQWYNLHPSYKSAYPSLQGSWNDDGCEFLQSVCNALVLSTTRTACDGSLKAVSQIAQLAKE